MRYLYSIIIVIVIISFGSCRKDFETVLSNGNLSFSKDTIFLNRIFDNISSSTHRFTVRNNSDDDITIPNISLARGESSFYRLNVDGIAGKHFENIDILAKDSIFVFVEATGIIDFDQINEIEFMYTDEIIFDSGSNEQKVELEALVLDVNLIRPDRTQIDGEDGFVYETIILGIDGEGNTIGVEGVNLEDDTVWTNEKPYLVYGFVGVPENKSLTIEAGTQVYFHANSGIIVQNNASLIVNGEQSITEELENQVVFQADRLEEDFAEIAGQWGVIWLREGSINSVLNHTTIKNSTIGLLVDSNGTISAETLIANNTQIYNSSSYGMLARNAKITAKNVVISNNGQASFATQLGGNYNFIHATLANYWQNSSSRQEPALLLSNALQVDQTTILVTDLNANFTNCIIDGNQNVEFVLDQQDGATFNFKFKNTMLKFNDTNNNFTEDRYDFTNTNLYENVIQNQDPNFKNTNSSEGVIDLIIGDDSFANAAADPTIIGSDVILQNDILGVDRIASPDIGAYQHITFEDDE